MQKKIKIRLGKKSARGVTGYNKQNCQKQFFEKIKEERRSDVNFQYWNKT